MMSSLHGTQNFLKSEERKDIEFFFRNDTEDADWILCAS